MPIDFGGGTMQIGRLLVEISRFLFLVIFISFEFGCLWMVLDVSCAVICLRLLTDRGNERLKVHKSKIFFNKANYVCNWHHTL